MDSSGPQIYDRAIGCFLGLAIGDALGTTLEFAVRDSKPPVTEIVGGGPFRLNPGEWTDDTSMALALADSLIACGDLNERDLLQRFLRWYHEGENSVKGRCFDIGVQTSQSLGRFAASGTLEAASTDPSNGGNGSIMRLAPVAIRWHNDLEAAIAAAKRQSRTTHAALEPIEGCAVLAAVLYDAITTGDRAKTLRARESSAPKIAAAASGNYDGARDTIKSTGYVVDTLEAALWSVATTQTFEEALVLAVNLGNDADTVGAVTGQIAGALYGRAGIPERWIDVLAWRGHIEQRARQLFEAGS